MKCIICGNNQAKKHREIKSQIDRRYYPLFLCPHCKSSFFQIPSDFNAKDFYSGTDREPVKAGFSQETWKSPVWENEVKTIRSLMKNDLKSVLDLGCSRGDFLAHFGKKIDKYGVELENYAIYTARQRGVHIFQEDIESMRIDREFDVVTAYAVLEHMKNPVKILNKISNLVKPGGAAVIMVPTRQCLKTQWMDSRGIPWHMYSPPAHITYLSRGYMDHTMKKRGFSLIKRKYTTGGIGNPLKDEGSLRRCMDKLLLRWDMSDTFSRLPVFDHMYSYYIKEI